MNSFGSDETLERPRSVGWLYLHWNEVISCRDKYENEITCCERHALSATLFVQWIEDQETKHRDPPHDELFYVVSKPYEQPGDLFDE